MDIGHAIIKAVVQGLTEFLPISSSAHLILTDAISSLMGAPSPNPAEEEFFDILLHIGTMLAVIYYFRKDLTVVCMALLGKPVHPDDERVLHPFHAKKLVWHIGVSTLITGIFIGAVLFGSKWLMASMGWATESIQTLNDFYRLNPEWVGLDLLITGCLLYFTEMYSARRQTGAVQELTMRQAVTVGLFQGFAGAFRGISRSGSTISGGLLSGMDRLTATRYSFLISIPAFMMAAVYEAVKLTTLDFGANLNWPAMLLGFVITAVVGYYCVKYLIRFVATNTLKGFAVYCWVVGTAMIVFFGFLN